MTVPQYAAHRVCSESLVWLWIKTFPDFPSIKQGRQRRLKWQVCDEWIDAGNLQKKLPSEPNKRRTNARRPEKPLTINNLEDLNNDQLHVLANRSA